MGAISVGVLGPLEVHRDGDPLDLGAPKPRTLLTAMGPGFTCSCVSLKAAA